MPQDIVMAHMFFNLAGANGLEQAKAERDNVAKAMSTSQIEQATDKAIQWVQEHQ